MRETVLAAAKADTVPAGSFVEFMAAKAAAVPLGNAAALAAAKADTVPAGSFVEFMAAKAAAVPLGNAAALAAAKADTVPAGSFVEFMAAKAAAVPLGNAAALAAAAAAADTGDTGDTGGVNMFGIAPADAPSEIGGTKAPPLGASAFDEDALRSCSAICPTYGRLPTPEATDICVWPYTGESRAIHRREPSNQVTRLTPRMGGRPV